MRPGQLLESLAREAQEKANRGDGPIVHCRRCNRRHPKRAPCTQAERKP